MTNYQDTDFSKVTFDFPHAELIGKNINLNGSSYKLQDGSYYEIKDPISAEEIERRSGPYMAAMLRNNYIQPRSGKKTVFAMSPTGLNSDVVGATNRCNDIFGSGLTYTPINLEDMQKIIHSFNQTYGAEFNTEFVADDGITPYDYRITLCETWDAPRLGLQTPNIKLVDRENYIEISKVLTNVAALSHEFFHILGGNHPFDAGVLPTKSSRFATVLSYINAIDLMLPIAGETSPLKLPNYQAYDPFTHQGIAVQDRDFLTIILGANPNYHPQDVVTKIHSGMTRIIHADKDNKNTAVIDKNWKDKYVVLDASQSIGTCFKFPCDPSDNAAGVSGTLVVFYDDSGPKVKVTGNVLLFGGKENQVIADGKVIEPINPAIKPLVNGANVTSEEFQAEIYQRKMRSNGEIVDLSDLQDVVIQTKSIIFYPYDKIENVIEGLDVSGTNFATVFNLDGKYFKNCNFAGCRFGSTTDTSFDGCDLTDADMSDTVQVGLCLGADLDHINNQISGEDSSIHQGASHDQLVKYQEFKDAVQATKFVNVNLRGAVLKKSSNIYAASSDNYLTDYSQTDFKGVLIIDRDVLQGQNLNLEGAIFKADYSKMLRRIKDPISAEEVASHSGSYLEAMMRNNIIHRKDSDQKTIIAVSSTLQESDQVFLDKCFELFPYEDVSNFRAVNVTDLQDLADIYNSELGTKYNVEFVVDAPNQNRGFRLNICFNNYAGAGQARTIGLLDPELYINLGYGSTRHTKLHELGHILGANHPFESGIDPTKCSVMSSVMCYPNAIDIMLPLGNSNEPARLNYFDQENLAPQDHKFVSFLFGENPDYQPQNYQANIAAGQNRIIYGDDGYNNSATLDTSSLPEGVKWIVLDAAKSIGTCYNFPCQKEDLAEGLAGNLLVLYKDGSQYSRPEVIGSTLLFGGKENNFFVDGQKIEPISPDLSITTMPSSPPTTEPSETPSNLPTNGPTRSPSQLPTSTPSYILTFSPSDGPTLIPTTKPSEKLTNEPTQGPSQLPTVETQESTLMPSFILTFSPSGELTLIPTPEPSKKPSQTLTSESNSQDKKDNPDFINKIIYGVSASVAGVAILASVAYALRRNDRVYITAETSEDDGMQRDDDSPSISPRSPSSIEISVGSNHGRQG